MNRPKSPDDSGVRQSSGASATKMATGKSGRGLPHSKTLPRGAIVRDLDVRQSWELPVKQIPAQIIGLSLVCLALVACHSKENASPPSAAAPSVAANQTAAQPAVESAPVADSSPSVTINTPNEAISEARKSLKAGNVDEAAARLAQVRLEGAKFNTQQAKDYRQALSEAYDRAIEAAQRGDPKGQAAIQLLRAAAPR